MNKETICLYGGYMYYPIDKIKQFNFDSIEKDALGGSDSWLVYTAEELSKIGFDVSVVCDCGKYHITENGTKYYPVYDSHWLLKDTKFRYLISNDEFGGLTFYNAEVKIMMVHSNGFKVFESEDRNRFTEDAYYKICYLSEFQKQRFIEQYGLTQEWKFNKVRIGIDWNLYTDTNQYVKKNKMVWSSHKSRGLGFFIEKVFPLIRQQVPDFELEFCSYLDETDGVYDNIEGIVNLGQLTKHELANKQKEAKIWVYPNTGVFEGGVLAGETFCLTCVENVAAGNAVVVANKHGFSDTLNGYSGFVGDDLFDDNSWVMSDEGKQNEFAKVLAERAVELLLNEEYRNALVNELYDICKQYTFENSLYDFLNVMKKKNSRLDFSEYMVDNLKTRLVFHWWIPQVKTPMYHKINDLHLACLKYYNNRFNETVMVLSCDDTNDTYVEVFKKKIFDLGIRGDIQIKIIKNNHIYREGVTYNDEIMHKLDKLDGITFFGHNKGTSKYITDKGDFERLLLWNNAMYYMNLDNFNHVRHHMSETFSLCYGTFLFINQTKQFRLNENDWCYLGSFQWINTKKLYDYIGGNKSGYDTGDAEMFIPSKVPFHTDRVRSYRFTRFVNECFNVNKDLNEGTEFFYNLLNSISYGEHLENFYEFHTKMCSDTGVLN